MNKRRAQALAAMTPADRKKWDEARLRIREAMRSDGRTGDDLISDADIARMTGLSLAEFHRLRQLDLSFPRATNEPLQ